MERIVMETLSPPPTWCHPTFVRLFLSWQRKENTVFFGFDLTASGALRSCQPGRHPPSTTQDWHGQLRMTCTFKTPLIFVVLMEMKHWSEMIDDRATSQKKSYISFFCQKMCLYDYSQTPLNNQWAHIWHSFQWSHGASRVAVSAVSNMSRWNRSAPLSW